MATIYVPDEIVSDVEYLKLLRRQGRAYNITLYCKEDNEKEEEKFPHTPLREEEKEKEESITTTTTTKKSKKSSFFPSLDEVKAFHKELGITSFTAERFYSYYHNYGWKSKGGGHVEDWKEKMKDWFNKDKHKNDDTRKKVHGTDTTAGYREEEDWRALGEWLDANYPVSAETIAAADEALKNPKFTLKWWGYRIGTTATIRIVIKKLYRLGEALNTSRKGLKPEKLERIANEIMRMSYLKTFEDLDIFFTQCKQGQYGNFPKGLQMTDILRALGKYLRP